MGFFQNRAIEFRDRSLDLIEQFQKFFAPPASPRSQAQAEQLGAALLGEQLFLATEPLAQGQRVQLVAQHGAQADQLVAMPKQLPQIPLRRCGHPDSWKAFREQ